MDNYEVNVLTRKGGWKKLPQEVITDKEEFKLNNSDNLNIPVMEALRIVSLMQDGENRTANTRLLRAQQKYK